MLVDKQVFRRELELSNFCRKSIFLYHYRAVITVNIGARVCAYISLTESDLFHLDDPTYTISVRVGFCDDHGNLFRRMREDTRSTLVGLKRPFFLSFYLSLLLSYFFFSLSQCMGLMMLFKLCFVFFALDTLLQQEINRLWELCS